MIVTAIRRTPKYAPLCASVIERAAVQAVGRYRTRKEAEKAARRRLHQIYGAYLSGTWLTVLQQALGGVDEGTVEDSRAFCRPLLDLHASTRERTDDLDRLFVEIFTRTGHPERVLDLACGLSPLTIPWMDPLECCDYTAVDLHEGLIEALNAFFSAFSLKGEAVCGDVLEWSRFEADVVFLLKVLPCLARQKKDADLLTIARIPSQWVVASYPSRSLSGRNVGMVSHHETRLREIAELSGRKVFPVQGFSEAVYVLEKLA